jgi:predicted FMN-binding regulatory protein PaiB
MSTRRCECPTLELRTERDGRDELVGHVADSVEAKVKMSQNRTEADRVRVMSMLDGSSDVEASAALRLMRDRFDGSGQARQR